MEHVKLTRNNKTNKLHLGVSGMASEVEQTVTKLDNFALREPYDRVIRCLGWHFDTSIFAE